jgi:hypothetical protein
MSPSARIPARIPFLWALACGALLAAGSATALAQGARPLSDWGFDPGALLADGQSLLRRAPDREIDALFQALHGASREPAEAAALCALFQPQADRSLAGLNQAASRLGPTTRERFALAVADVLVAATRSPPQAFDPAQARQALKAAGATAAILDEDFLPGLHGDDPDARCRSFGLLLDGLAMRPLPERAAVTRLLLFEGLTLAGSGIGSGVD